MIIGKRIGLALSGGGVRAAAFHLGVLDKLNELNILKNIDIISTVSGGSIIGAFYVVNQNNFNDFKEKMIRNLKKSIEARILLNPLLIKAMLFPNYSRTNVKANVYNRLYFHKKTFSALNKTPRLVINATNLATGKNWKFTQEYMGDWKISYDGLVGIMKIADAVAASSAVPGVFHPIKIDVKTYFTKPNFPTKKIALCDGGVYDNQGTHALLSGYKEPCCDYVICSDASFPFDDTPKSVSFRLLKVLKRQSNIMMDRIKNIQFQNLIYGRYKKRVKAAYFSIDWTLDELLRKIYSDKKLVVELKNSQIISDAEINILKENEEIQLIGKVLKKVKAALAYPEFINHLHLNDVDFISSIGTRLRKLTDHEISKLMLHGSNLCGFQVRTFMNELLV